jgi:sugar transferase (PEP-CTERM/EpsH1 system associated)
VRILFLTHRLPYAPNRGDRIRSHHILREIRNWADVDLVSLVHDHEEASHVAELSTLVTSVHIAQVPWLPNALRAMVALPTAQPLTHSMLRAPRLSRAIGDAVRAHPPDIVFAYCTGIAPIAFDPPLRDVPLVLDMVDVDSAKWAALAAGNSPPRSWIYAREARTLSHFERKATQRAAVTLVSTAPEAATLACMAPSARIEVVQNGVDVDAWRPPDPPVESSTAVFCGVMNYRPNVDGAIWLATEVWPLVRKVRPDARLQIVGAHPTRAVLALANETARIEVSGAVPDVRPFLWAAAVAAAPLMTARGVQNKVLEAVAAGLPTVVTPEVFKGVPVEIAGACTTAHSAPQFADSLLHWLEQPPDARREHARRAEVAGLSWAGRLSGLRGLLEGVADPRVLP